MKATPGVVGDLIACPGSDVATCTCASNVEAVLTCASTKVKQTVIPAATPPVITCIAKADNHANCTDGTVDGSSNKACTKCDAAYKLETNKCT